MAVLPILTFPDAALREPCGEVSDVTGEIRTLAQNMLETMYAAPGIGLAAPQVGVLKRLFVVDVHDADRGDTSEPMVFINPKITAYSEEKASYEEGCLSIPEMKADVIRPAEIEVSWLDLDGKLQKSGADGLLAVCIQHEYDHLNGKLFIDHLTRLKRNILLRKYNKQKQDN